MRHPLLAALALAPLALAACSDDGASACPGVEVATLVFAGTLTDALDPALDPAPSTPGCVPEQIPYDDALAPFTATVSTDPDAGTAAFCRAGGRAQPLFGTLEAGFLDVSTATEGAVLGAPCPASCIAVMTLSVRGAISGAGAAARFDGAIVELLSLRPGADCGGCLLPCAARYAATGLPPAAP